MTHVGLKCIRGLPPEKEVTQEPKPLGAQLPYESDSLESGEQFYVRPRRRGQYI